jgi:hypothetical protein
VGIVIGGSEDNRRIALNPLMTVKFAAAPEPAGAAPPLESSEYVPICTAAADRIRGLDVGHCVSEYHVRPRLTAGERQRLSLQQPAK